MKCMGVGVVIHDEVGNFLASFSVHAPLLFDCQIAEAFVATRAMRLALETGFSQIHLKGNCLFVIQAVNHNDPYMSYIGILLADVKQLLNFCSAWKASFVRRECNSAAYYLAKFPKNIDNFLSLIKETLDFLLPLLQSDVSRLS